MSRNLIARTLTIGLVATAAIVLAVTPAQADTGHDEPPRAEQGTPEPENLPRGHADYTNQEGDDATTASYPTDCGFWVTLSRSGTTLTGSTLTVCDYKKQRIWHRIRIQRSRWWGWETMKEATDWRNDVWNFALDRKYYCSGTGIHDFRVVGNGQVVTYSGNIYKAAAYDRIDNVNCGS